MKIGIIGSGMIGGTLGKLFSRAGHVVMFSSRHPDQLAEMAKQNNAITGNVNEACTWGDLVLLAVPFKFVADLGKQYHHQLQGKIIIDACNPYPERDGSIAQQVVDNPNFSSGEVTQQNFSSAMVVKAFNATYYKVLLSEAFKEGDERLAVPVAGDDIAAKAMVHSLIEGIGMAPVDFGELKNGKKFEPGTLPYNANISIKEAMQKWDIDR